MATECSGQTLIRPAVKPRAPTAQSGGPDFGKTADPNDVGIAAPYRLREPQRGRGGPLHASNALDPAQLLDRVEADAIVAQEEQLVLLIEGRDENSRNAG